MKLSLLAVLAATGAAALPTSDSPAHAARAALESRATTCSVAATDKLIFKASMATFQKARRDKNPSKCNWSSDKCSWSPDKPAGFNFVPSCERHDFGYRNTKSQGRFTKAMKTRVDDNFKKDLYNYCAQFSGLASLKGVECRRIADTYVFFVRKFGKRDVPIESAEEEQAAAAAAADEGFTKNEGSVLDIELDDDIEGQVIPEIEEKGEDVDDLDAWFGPDEE
ncbi:Phospholipase A2 [Cordyceps fumosorosea ARSEF 2679]|uniref:Phospholipase A2 n=1 Tax=Cordyceps fumosorosea (strain ARSEF 2679) TaxID=1081104 RepID=A0A168B207_CORFA|nr:Phospholipase A2 [Cordyceps fumosorosea ARSEF 2679]OAA69506.1 Phospholipase A2 [Cordyceps fumosorosea ARSEF 2679]